MRRILAASGTAVLIAFVFACSGSPSSTPSTPTTPTTPSAPTVSSVAVTGSAPNVGASAAFTATATLSNSTAQTVTSQATWQSSNGAVATVTSSGVVTGMSAGTADITATYQNVSGIAHVTINRATPLTYTITGTVTDGTSHGVLPNITILSFDSADVTKTTLTDGNGNYSIAGVASGVVAVTASAISYQTTTQSVTLNGNTRVDITLPRVASGGGGGGGGGTGGGGSSLTCNGASVPATVSCPNNGGIQPPTAKCNDGSYSCSQNRSGTCSSHSGVACWVCPGPLC